MANAKKCDRCDTYYDYPKKNERAGVCRDITARNRLFMDLCPDCQSSLEDWIGSNKGKEIAAPIYGVSGLTDKNPALNRTDDAMDEDKEKAD